MVVVVMGVCGCGKSTVGEALAVRLDCAFLDADAFHPAANVARMVAGQPLTDDDRWPWLDRLAGELRERLARGERAVLACSALKASYRERLARAGDVRFAYLRGDRELLAARLAGRSGHYMPPSLLDSQLATLEEPDDAIVLDVRDAVTTQVESIVRALAQVCR